MEALFSDISGKEIGKHLMATKDAQVIIGGVILHMHQDEQVELLEYIAKLQEERMPKRFEGDFEPWTDARKTLDAYEERKRKAQEFKENGIDPSEVFDSFDDINTDD